VTVVAPLRCSAQRSTRRISGGETQSRNTFTHTPPHDASCEWRSKERLPQRVFR
jgi:hypothetical protein